MAGIPTATCPLLFLTPLFHSNGVSSSRRRLPVSSGYSAATLADLFLRSLPSLDFGPHSEKHTPELFN